MLDWWPMKVLLAILLSSSAATAQQTSIHPGSLPRVGSVSERFQSYNVEMIEVTGGRFWKPYASTTVAANTPLKPGEIDPNLYEQRTPINLSNPRLRKLAAALGPAYLRVSGTWANTTYFQDSDAPAPAKAPEGFGGVLTRAEWKSVVDFSKAVNAEIVTSFSVGAGTRDANGLWTPVEAEKFLRYNASLGGHIAAAEFMNEPTFAAIASVPKGYDGPAYGRDFAVFQAYFRKALPSAKLLGPGSVGEGIDLVPMKLLPSKDMLAATGPNAVDAFSYHFYGGVSSRCGGLLNGKGATSPEAALTDDWLSRTNTVESFYAGLRDEYAAGKPIWLTETGQTACGGDRWASTYLDTFRYLNQMGTLAKRGVQTIMHNTLAASDYALIDEKTTLPRPNYWAALLWHKMMGTTVLDAGPSPSPSLYLYAHCMQGKPGGVTLLALNASQKDEAMLVLSSKPTRYTLTAPELKSPTVQLNGTAMKVAADGSVPPLQGSERKSGPVTFAPATITFLTMAGAGNPACK